MSAFKQGAQGVAKGWARVDQGERGLGLQGRTVATGERNAATAEKNATTNATNRGASYIPSKEQLTHETLQSKTLLARILSGKDGFEEGAVKDPNAGYFWQTKASEDPNYKTFLKAIETETQKVLNTQRSGWRAEFNV